MIESVGWWIDAPTTSKLAPINGRCINGEFLCLGCMGGVLTVPKWGNIVIFMPHILIQLLPFLYSLECLCDYAMQITAMDIGGYVTMPERWNNKSLLYVSHNLLLRRLCQNIAMGWGIGLIRACNESTTQRTIQNQMNSFFMQSLSCFEDSGIVGTSFSRWIVQSDGSDVDTNLDAIWP